MTCVIGPAIVICAVIIAIIVFPKRTADEIKENWGGMFVPSWIRQYCLREYYGFKEVGYWKDYYDLRKRADWDDTL